MPRAALARTAQEHFPQVGVFGYTRPVSAAKPGKQSCATAYASLHGMLCLCTHATSCRILGHTYAGSLDDNGTTTLRNERTSNPLHPIAPMPSNRCSHAAAL